MQIEGISGLGALGNVGGASPSSQLAPSGGASGGVNFGELMNGLQEIEQDGASSIQDLAVGAEGDLHDAMLNVELESIAFELAVQVRNRLVDAYQEIFRMSV
jgi:flagellar hook-basal body complex protein FliE